MTDERVKDLSCFIDLCFRLAELIDARGEAGDHFLREPLGMGYCVASNRLRSGISEILRLCSELHTARMLQKMAVKTKEDNEEFLKFVFGDIDPYYAECEEVRQQIRDAVKEIVKKYEMEHDDD